MGGQAHRPRTGFIRIDPGQLIVGEIDAVDLPVHVDPGIALVGGDLIMDIGVWSTPVPLREHNVAFHALWTRWLRRDFAGFDAIGPIGKHLQRAFLAELIEHAAHLHAPLTRLEALLPSHGTRMEGSERRRNLTRRLVSELMAQLAAVLHLRDPVRL